MTTLNQYDHINVPLFEQGEHNKYLCSMCGQYTTLEDSISHQGYNLICNRCSHKISALLNIDYIKVLKYVQDAGLWKDRNFNEMIGRIKEIKGEYKQ